MENNQYKISVIVPAYNSAQFIAGTIENLLNQSFKDIELIVVNDGSTDETEQIILDYEKKYSNVKCITKENGGVSSARNCGLEVATGKYVCFQDADDMYDSRALEAFYKRAEETDADVVIGRLRTFTDEDGLGKFNAFGDVLSAMDEIDPFDLQLLWNFLVGNKFYKRDRLVESGVRFPPYRYSEEGAFFMSYVYTLPKIVGAYDSVFIYRRHSKKQGLSVSQTVSAELAKSFCHSLDMIYEGANKATEAMDKQKRDEYLGEILYKKAYVLTSQFYRLMWHGDDECVEFCKNEITKLLSLMPANRKNSMLFGDSDLRLNNMPSSKAEVANNPGVSVILKSGKGDINQFVIDMYDQLSPMFELVIPESVKNSGKISEEYLSMPNLKVIEDKNFVKKAKEQAKGKVIVFKKAVRLDIRMIRLVYKLKTKLPEKIVNMFFPIIAKMLNFALVRKIIK